MLEMGGPDDSLDRVAKRQEATGCDLAERWSGPRTSCGCATRTTSCPGHPAMSTRTPRESTTGSAVRSYLRKMGVAGDAAGSCVDQQVDALGELLGDGLD